MKAFRRRFASNEVRDALDVLNEIGSQFDCEAFQIVRGKLEDDFLDGKIAEEEYNTQKKRIQTFISEKEKEMKAYTA